MNKKLFALLFITIFSLSMTTVSAETYRRLIYSVSDGEVTITGNTYSSGEATIPESINGYPVTAIGKSAFMDSPITSVFIPSTVKTIQDSAFMGCISLSSIIIPDSVTTIEKAAFSYCEGLESVTIPDSVTVIGASAFSQCETLGTITIPDSVTVIGDNAFAYCNNLASVTLGRNATSLGEHIFQGCTGLTDITIPDGVTTIGKYMFSYCESLEKIVIGKDVTTIDNYAFSNCEKLTNVSLCEIVSRIGEAAFYGCTALKSIYLPESITTIENHAFNLNTSLTQINVSVDNPNYSSSDGVLFNKNKETLITYPIGKSGTYDIPDTVKVIGEFAFAYASGLMSVSIPDSVKSIENCAFWGCTGLSSVSIPGSVETMGYSIFMECANLTEINVHSSNQNFLSIDGVLFDADKKTLIKYPPGRSGDYVVPDGVISLGRGSFYKSKGLVSVILPNSVTTIENQVFSFSGISNIVLSSNIQHLGSGIFSDCGNLIHITIPDGFPEIPNRMFSGCKNLTSISMPNSITSIGVDAFSSCSSLTSIILPSSVKTIEDWAFAYCRTLKTIVLPAGISEIKTMAYYQCNAIETVYYKGNNTQWAGILIGDSNNTLTNANIIFNAVSSTKTSISTSASGEKTFTVVPSCLPTNAQIILVCFKDGRLVEFKSEPNQSETISFTTNKDFNCAKVMVRNYIGSISPVCSVEIVK